MSSRHAKPPFKLMNIAQLAFIQAYVHSTLSRISNRLYEIAGAAYDHSPDLSVGDKSLE